MKKRAPRICPVCDGPLTREGIGSKKDRFVECFSDLCKNCAYNFDGGRIECEESIGMIRLYRRYNFRDDRHRAVQFANQFDDRYKAIEETRRLWRDEEFQLLRTDHNKSANAQASLEVVEASVSDVAKFLRTRGYVLNLRGLKQYGVLK